MTRTGTVPAERSQPAMLIRPATHSMYPYIAAALVILFIASVARFYHPGTGFTALIGFPAGDSFSSQTLRDTPHYEYPAWASYDGQFYAQRAFDPFLRDPDIDRGMDSPPFRARRILFSWTAYVLGLGRPAWILEAYALQNVFCWLLTAVLLRRWVPVSSGRGLALWTACLFSHGMLWSVRFSLLDGPSLLMIAWAVAASESGRSLSSAAIAGVAGLGRETNLLATFAQPVPAGRRTALRAGAGLVLAALPVLLWYDYLWSIYRSTLLKGADSFVLPGTGLARVWGAVLAGVARDGVLSGDGLSLCLLLALAVQACYLFLWRDYESPWWRVAAAYAVMMLFLHPTLVNPHTGAITRVLLAMTVGFNVLLAKESRSIRFWPWFITGNLHLIPVFRVMPLIPWQ